jgi:hypothetical protein
MFTAPLFGFFLEPTVVGLIAAVVVLGLITCVLAGSLIYKCRKNVIHDRTYARDMADKLREMGETKIADILSAYGTGDTAEAIREVKKLAKLFGDSKKFIETFHDLWKSMTKKMLEDPQVRESTITYFNNLSNLTAPVATATAAIKSADSQLAAGSGSTLGNPWGPQALHVTVNAPPAQAPAVATAPAAPVAPVTVTHVTAPVAAAPVA